MRFPYLNEGITVVNVCFHMCRLGCMKVGMWSNGSCSFNASGFKYNGDFDTQFKVVDNYYCSLLLLSV